MSTQKGGLKCLLKNVNKFEQLQVNIKTIIDQKTII